MQKKTLRSRSWDKTASIFALKTSVCQSLNLLFSNTEYVAIVYFDIVKDAPQPLLGQNGEYLQGQYKVGLDIPEGRYKIDCGKACSVAYFVHNKLGSAFFDKADQVSPTTMSGYLDLQEGDYIYLYR